jgi:Holliday junction resolvasome RuvABC DNA-binding subunit
MRESDKHSNEQIAAILEKIASLLEVQEENAFRVRSYRTAARNILHLERPVAGMFLERGEAAILEIEGVGKALAGVVEEIIRTDHSSLLDRLQGEVSPVTLFSQIPGVGEDLAQKIVDSLNIKTLEELELAAHDGRLEKVKGFGQKKVEAIQEILAGRLSHSSQRRVLHMDRETLHEKTSSNIYWDEESLPEPPIEVLLEIDEEYRIKAEMNTLPKIAPKRFNPEGTAWLPILHEDRREWSFTALYSNTALAHRQHATHDWVVIYYKYDENEQQCTVVTSHHPGLEGKRVIRGREAECKTYYHGGH